MSFCHVERSIHIGQEIIDITEGNQKQQGGIPSLIRSPIIKSEEKIVWLNGMQGDDIILNPLKRIMPEPRA